MRVTDYWTIAFVRSVRDLTPTVRELELVPDDGAIAFAAGSHIDVRVHLRDGDTVRQETRSYSLVGRPDGHSYRIAVKRLDDGLGGWRYMWTLAPGARVSISSPANHFVLDLAAQRVLLIAGGIGITPIVGMAQTLSDRGADVSMCYGARSAAEFAYLDLLRAALG
ncbi:MAG: ferredoxin reductase, partial [Burkholderiales bacterium]